MSIGTITVDKDRFDKMKLESELYNQIEQEFRDAIDCNESEESRLKQMRAFNIYMDHHKDAMERISILNK